MQCQISNTTQTLLAQHNKNIKVMWDQPLTLVDLELQ